MPPQHLLLNGGTARKDDAPNDDPAVDPDDDKNKPEIINKKKTSENVVFNYSSITITEPMNRLLNRGLNFSVLPSKLDITQLFVDYKKFARSAIWKEFHHGKNEEQTEGHIFKRNKSNLPKNYTVPEDLKIFLSSVKSEIADPRNRNQVKCNLPPEELQALKQLQQMQRDRQIVIRACDKGAGIIILNFEDYIRAVYYHLTSEQSPGHPYYSEVNDFQLDKAKKLIKDILNEGIEREIINKSEFGAMNADDMKAGCFYCNLKVHKEHSHIAPPRPITSGSGSII